MSKKLVSGYGEVMVAKDEYASSGRGSQSVRDFGGVYLVHGRYLFKACGGTNVQFLSMVDTSASNAEFLAEVAKFRREHPKVEVELVQKDFRNADTFASLKNTDKSLLYEVLLHQENYVDVIKMVQEKTNKEIVMAQPVLKPRLFGLPSSSSLVQFWPEELKDEMRHAGFWPKEEPSGSLETSKWMWGHTASHLDDVFRGFGWKKNVSSVISNVAGEYWDYYLASYSRK